MHKTRQIIALILSCNLFLTACAGARSAPVDPAYPQQPTQNEEEYLDDGNDEWLQDFATSPFMPVTFAATFVGAVVIGVWGIRQLGE